MRIPKIPLAIVASDPQIPGCSLIGRAQVFSMPASKLLKAWGLSRIIYLILFLCFPYFNFLLAQPGPVPEKAKKMYQKGLILLQERDFEGAISVLESTVSKYPQYGRAQLTLAELYLQAGRSEQAMAAFQELHKREPDLSFRPLWHLARIAHSREAFESSAAYWIELLDYLNIPEETRREAQKGKDDALFASEAIRNPVPYSPINLGGWVNSSDDEYIPLFNADHSQLIFTRLIDNKQEDLLSVRFSNGEPVENAVALPPPLNSPSNEGGHTMSQDGRLIIFTACNRADGKGSCDLYSSMLTSSGWSTPVNLGTPINSPSWESQPSLSFDGRTLYFTSKRPGGSGGTDIWMSRLQPSGTWGVPVPLDMGVNTPGDEKFPFMHPDDHTLYFTSTGHPGMGKSDLFVARRGAKGYFEKAINLGYPINTIGEESGLFVSRDGQFALISSQRPGGYGRGDLYRLELPHPSRPLLASFVAGSVVDSTSGRPLEAQVEIVRLADGVSVYKTQTLPVDGGFLTSLPRQERYAFQVQKNGYLLYSQHFDLNVDTANARFMIPLSPVQAGREVVLQNVFFAHNESILDTMSRTEIVKLAEFLTLNLELRLEIQGHTDHVGPDDANLLLSDRRAKSVYDALIAQGIGNQRLTYKGYGETRPVASNLSELGRSKNRRTSFVVLPN